MRVIFQVLHGKITMPIFQPRGKAKLIQNLSKPLEFHLTEEALDDILKISFGNVKDYDEASTLRGKSKRAGEGGNRYK